MTFLSHFAAETTATNPNLFIALGIDWRLLIIQIIAFLLLVFLLSKFVYPWLMKSVDERQANIEAAAQASAEAQKAAEENKAAVAELLAEARKEANEILSTAKLESNNTLAASEKKASQVAERIVAEAHEQVEKDVASARKTLYNDTLDLVSMATEKVIATKLDKKTDDRLVADAVATASKAGN